MSLLSNVAGFSLFLLVLLYATGAFHVIDYGYIGVYKRGGALLSSWTEPGLHFMIPFLTTYSAVQVTIQTDKVTDIPVPGSLGSAAPAAE
jgi:regulator of protease activity HflC (stomatin/prohibitin superfamily)